MIRLEKDHEEGSCRISLDIGGAQKPPALSSVRVNLEPGKVERGLLKLVLSLVELIRQVMEKQAMRRIDHGDLTSEEIDRLGRSLMELETKIRDLQEQFEIEDLNIELGPLGKLLD